MSDELFLLIGRLYYDLIRSQTMIENLKKQLEMTQQNNDFLSNNK